MYRDVIIEINHAHELTDHVTKGVVSEYIFYTIDMAVLTRVSA